MPWDEKNKNIVSVAFFILKIWWFIRFDGHPNSHAINKIWWIWIIARNTNNNVDLANCALRIYPTLTHISFYSTHSIQFDYWTAHFSSEREKMRFLFFLLLFQFKLVWHCSDAWQADGVGVPLGERSKSHTNWILLISFSLLFFVLYFFFLLLLMFEIVCVEVSHSINLYNFIRLVNGKCQTKWLIQMCCLNYINKLVQFAEQKFKHESKTIIIAVKRKIMKNKRHKTWNLKLENESFYFRIVVCRMCGGSRWNDVWNQFNLFALTFNVVDAADICFVFFWFHLQTNWNWCERINSAFESFNIQHSIFSYIYYSGINSNRKQCEWPAFLLLYFIIIYCWWFFLFRFLLFGLGSFTHFAILNMCCCAVCT